jgi:hypothetical protein
MVNGVLLWILFKTFLKPPVLRGQFKNYKSKE